MTLLHLLFYILLILSVLEKTKYRISMVQLYSSLEQEQAEIHHDNGNTDDNEIKSKYSWGPGGWLQHFLYKFKASRHVRGFTLTGFFLGLTLLIWVTREVVEEMEYELHIYENRNELKAAVNQYLLNSTNLPPIRHWKVSKVEDFSSLFESAQDFNEDITNWDTSSATSFHFMFRNARSFNQSLVDWNTHRVADMSGMFQGAESFHQDLSRWQTSRVTNMALMFSRATHFNGDISTWDTYNVKNMASMFSKASKFNGNIDSWKTIRVTDMSAMFLEAAVFDQNIGPWITSSVEDMSEMFANARSFNQDVRSWDTSHVNNFDLMFFDAKSFNQDISSWSVQSVKRKNGYGFISMFDGATRFRQDMCAWKTTVFSDASESSEEEWRKRATDANMFTNTSCTSRNDPPTGFCHDCRD